MICGGSLSSRRLGSRDDVSVEFLGVELDQRLPTSTRGSSAMAADRLADHGVLPGRYSGIEQAFTAAGAIAPAEEPCACEIRPDGSLTVTSHSSGDITTFTWALDRWRWSPHRDVIVEAWPRCVGAITVIDFFSCEGRTQRPAARFYLARPRC